MSTAELASHHYDWLNLQEECAHHVESGTYGPFVIGETKAEALRRIEASGIRHVNLVLSSGLLGAFANVEEERDALLNGEDTWSLDALDSLCPFEPFYSRVSLHFEGQRLHLIEHFCLAYELL